MFGEQRCVRVRRLSEPTTWTYHSTDDQALEAASAWYLHRSLLAQDETLLSTTGAGAMEQRGSRGAAA